MKQIPFDHPAVIEYHRLWDKVTAGYTKVNETGGRLPKQMGKWEDRLDRQAEKIDQIFGEGAEEKLENALAERCQYSNTGKTKSIMPKGYV